MLRLIDGITLCPGAPEGEEALRFIPDACVQIDGPTIVYAGPRASAPPFEGARIIDGRGRLALPGLVNAHTHLPMSLLRGFGSGLNLQDWLFTKMLPAEDRMTPESARLGAWASVKELLRYGITACADLYMFADTIAGVIAESGMRALLSRPIVDAPGPDRVAQAIALTQRWHGAMDGRIRCCMSPNAEYTASPETYRHVVNLAREYGVGIHVHISETQAEVAGCRERYGISPVRFAAEHGLFDVPCIAAHCVAVDEADIALLADHHVYVAHNPISNLKLASGVMPLPAMLAAGVNICLGTDGVASNNAHNLWEELRLTATLHKGVARDPYAVTEAQALRMATLAGAKAMGFDNVGLVQEGYRADIILLDVTGPHHTPCLDPSANLIFSAQGSDVSLTMIDGRVCYADGEYLTAQNAPSREAIQQEAERLIQGL